MGELTPYQAFCGPSYQGRSIPIASDRCINFYPEAQEMGTGKNKYHLIGTPGIHTVLDTELEQPIRGICTLGGNRLLVAGKNTLYEIHDSLETIGEIAADDEWNGLAPVTFAYNGVQWLICSGRHLYLLDGTHNSWTFNEVADMEADQIAYLDGYFIAMQKENRKVLISGLYDGTSWDPLDFKEKESSRDRPVAILADHGELWVFGETHSEVWYNSGNSDFPLDRRPEGRLEIGCAAAWSPVKLDNSIFWVGSDDRGNVVVWRADGYTAKRVSTHPIEYRMHLIEPQSNAVASIPSATTYWAIAYGYQEEGHSFYVLNFPLAPAELNRPASTEYTNPTALVYDCATQLWHERAWWNKATGKYEPPRQRCHGYIWGVHVVGDRANGKIYEQHLDYLDDAGERIRRERVGVHISNGMRQTFYNSFQLDMEVAVGLGVIDSSIYGADVFGKEYQP